MGSEPGTGWNTASSLAAHCDVTVVTRSNNRKSIEGSEFCPAGNVSPGFIYVDPAPWLVWLKARGVIPTQVFYGLWHLELVRQWRRIKGDYDIVHQLTFNTFEFPPMIFHRLKCVKFWGPLGGGQCVPIRLLPAFGFRSGVVELLRNCRVKLSTQMSFVTRTLKECDVVLFANRETQDALGKGNKLEARLMIDVGVDVEKFSPISRRGRSENSVLVVLAAGRLEPRKGFSPLLDAFAILVKEFPNIVLRVVGQGPDEPRLKKKILRLGLQKNVELVGGVTHEQMREEFARADIFAFPSLRDTSGAVVLEAMAMELPVVCFNHQGAAIMVTSKCGVKVPVLGLKECVSAFAEGLRLLLSDRDLRLNMGEEARRIVKADFDWKQRALALSTLYSTCLSKGNILKP